MHNWHSYELQARETMRERLSEAERGRLVKLARGHRPEDDLAWPRLVVWAAGSALVAVGERLVVLAHSYRAYDLRDTTWSPGTKSYAGG